MYDRLSGDYYRPHTMAHRSYDIPSYRKLWVQYGSNESSKTHVQGFIVKELCEHPNNWRCSIGTDEYFKKNNIIGLKGIDTRALTQHIRSFGSMFGIISTECGNVDVLLERLKVKMQEPRDLVMEVTTKEPIRIKGEGKVVCWTGNETHRIRYLEAQL